MGRKRVGEGKAEGGKGQGREREMGYWKKDGETHPDFYPN